MYTKKLLSATLNIKEILVMALMLAAIIAVFTFIEFQGARGDIDDIIEKNSIVTQEDLDKISVLSPAAVIAVFSSLAFGLAFLTQMTNLSLQVNVTRKHLYRAMLILQSICASIITLTVIPTMLGTNLLFSKFCTGDYAGLESKFRDAAFNTWVFSKDMTISSGIAEGILVMLLAVFVFTVIGTLLGMVLTRLRGAALAAVCITGFAIAVGLLIMLIFLHTRIISISVLAGVLIIMLIAQHRLIKTQSLDARTAIKAV